MTRNISSGALETSILPTAGVSADGCNPGHSIFANTLLRAPLMNRWMSLVGSMMLVLMLWTSATAHAAERFDCIPVSTEAAGHFDGDQDEVPSAPDQGVAHHHSGCTGHQLAAPTASDALELSFAAQTAPTPRQETGVPSHGPGALLRPPIA